MKKVVSALALTAALFAGAANAADLPSRKDAPAYVPPPPPAVWTGLYAGVNVGGGWMDSYNRNNGGWAWGGAGWGFGPGAVWNGGHSGVVGGGQVGYNYQIGSMFVVGLETDIQGTSIGGRRDDWGASTRGLDWFGTVRGRAGLVMPGWSNFLVYGTGGFAYGDMRLNPTYWGPGGWPFSTSLRTLATGWSAGGGVEWMVLPTVSLKGEYLYTNIGANNWGGFNNVEQRVNVHTIRAGLNYHINWFSGAPVLAKY